MTDAAEGRERYLPFARGAFLVPFLAGFLPAAGFAFALPDLP